MKKLLFYIVSLTISPLVSVAQQNLFNIPSGDINAQNKFFYQHQLNIYNFYTLESKSHLVYGLGSNWETGINVINKKFDLNRANQIPLLKIQDNPSYNPVSPLLLATAQKGFPLLPHNRLRINLGTQIGTNFINHGDNQLAFFNYAILASELSNHIKLTLGGYHTNRYFVGKGTDIGILLGYEIPLSKRWFLMGDMISGDHSNSVAVVGGMFNASKRIQLCLGGIVPMPENRTTPMGIVLEFNLLGWDLWED